MDEGAMGVREPSGTPEVPAAPAARMEGDEPFPVHVTARDRRAFAEEIFDQHADEVYRYVLAWTGDQAAAGELTAQVLRTAVARMERLTEPGTDVEARLVALARAALARRTEAGSEPGDAPGRNAGSFAAPEPIPLLLEAVARLDDGRREVVVLRQLLGHSTEHAARLLAFDVPVVEELERNACSTLWRRLNRAQETRAVSAWDALTVAAALRQGAQSWFAPPGEATLARLREQLVDAVDPERGRPAAAAAATEPAGDRRSVLSALLSGLLAVAPRHRWLLAGCVVSAAIGTVIALTMNGQAGQSSPCGGASTCLVSTSTGGVADTAQTFPSSPTQPATTTRLGAGAALPVLTGGTGTTVLMAPTTTMGGAASTASTSRPRGTTTLTTAPPTTAPPTTTEPPTTIEPPTTT